MAFSQKIRQEILVLSARHCSICHKSKGIKLEVHHIKPLQQGGTDEINNAIALCFDCHADAGHYFSGHPKGIKFSPSELMQHKEQWIKLVQEHKIQSQIDNITGKSVSNLKHALRMEKKIFKNLFDHKAIKENSEIGYYTYNPSHMFISLKIIIRNIANDIYPKYDDYNSVKIGSWFKTYIYNTYHRGIEVWLNPGQSDKIIMDNEGYWEVLENRQDERQKNDSFIILDSKLIGQIPYTAIVDLRVGGDEYTVEPHIFCKFDYEDEPYENIYYKAFGNYEKQIPDFTLDSEKQTTFQ